MVATPNLVEVAALVGDTARATMLAALMGWQALTGGELAFLAGVSRSTASEHLAKLAGARLVAVSKKRRFHYYRIASPLVAKMLESMKAVAAIEVSPRYQPRDGGEVTDSGRETLARFGADLTPASCGHRIFCRPCLDWSERRYHLAGHVGAEICRRCLELRWFKRERDTRAMQLTAAGRTGLAEFFGLRIAEYEKVGNTDSVLSVGFR